jgi:hypothetical protein
MYMYNFALGVMFAKARSVRNKDIFLDGILAAMVKSPAVGLVLVSALSPNQQRRLRTAAPIINTAVATIDSSGGSDTLQSVTLTGLNFAPSTASGPGAAVSTVSVAFQYVDGTVAITSVFSGQAVTGSNNDTIIVDLSTSDQAEGILSALTDPRAGVVVTVTINSLTSGPQNVTGGS